MDEKEKTISHKFILDPFPIEINLIGCKEKESLLNYFVNEGIEVDNNSLPDHSAYVFLRGESIYLVIYLPGLDNIGTICHESIHIVDKLFQAIEQPDHTITNDEFIPYYTGFITNQIIDFLKEHEIISLTFNLNKNE